MSYKYSPMCACRYVSEIVHARIISGIVVRKGKKERYNVQRSTGALDFGCALLLGLGELFVRGNSLFLLVT